MGKKNLLIILFSLILAILAGAFTHENTLFFGIPVIEIYDFLGQLFLNALKMMIVPLVVSSIIIGTSRIGNDHGGLTLAYRTFITFALLTLTAVLTGFIVAELLLPHLSVESLSQTSASLIKEEQTLFSRVKELIFRFFPPNIIQAAAEGQMIGLILFGFLFGFFSSHIDGELQRAVMDFTKGVFHISMKMTQFIIRFLPLAIFALVAKVIAGSGMKAIYSSSSYFITLVAAFLLFCGLILPLILRYVAMVNPWSHYKALSSALITAFTTSSSSATLPVTLECLEKEAGVSNRVASFTIPLGTSFLMAGAAIFETVAVLFIAKAYGIELGIDGKALLIALSFFLSMGIAGIPSASLVAVIAIVNILKLPAEGIALLLLVERFSDMCRTVVNVLTHSVACVVVARKEGETTSLCSSSKKHDHNAI
jgi:proton glutamate symport protein